MKKKIQLSLGSEGPLFFSLINLVVKETGDSKFLVLKQNERKKKPKPNEQIVSKQVL